MRLQPKLIILFFCVSIVPFGIIGYHTYTLSAESMEDHAFVHLNSVAHTRAGHLGSWIVYMQDNAKVVASAPSVVRNIEVMVTADPVSIEYRQAKDAVEAFGDIAMEGYATFDEIFILDRGGTVIASTNKNIIGDNRSSREYYREGLHAAHLTSAYISKTLNVPTILVSAPVLLDDNRTIGVVVCRTNFNMLHETIHDRTGLGTTGRAFLIDSNGFLVSGLADGAKTIPAVKNTSEDYCGIYTTSNGKKVIISRIWMPDQKWYLIAEQDHDEVLDPLNVLIERAIVVTICVIVLIGIFSVLTTWQITKPIERLHDGAEAVAAGDYSIQVPVVSNDEIGVLTQRFNEMTSELYETHRELQNTITLVNHTLENQKSTLESVLRSIPDCVFVIDTEFKIVMANQACKTLTGISEEAIIGMRCYDIFSSDACEPQCRLQELTEDHGGGVCWEMDIVDGEGRSVPIMTCGAPLHSTDGALIGYVEVLRNVTQMKRVTEELQRTNAELGLANAELKKLDELKTNFINIASHELRTPLTSIMGFTEFVADEMLGELNPRQKDALSKVLSNSDRLARLINNILDISVIQAGGLELKLNELDISELIKDIVADMGALAKNKNLTCTIDIPDHLTIEGDRNRIEQVVANLIGNAIRFTQERGSVSITGVDGGDWIQVAVSDTGIGIIPEDLPHVFEEFWQVEKSKGMGLGLAIVANIIHRHGGVVWASSAVGGGSIFAFKLPKKVSYRLDESGDPEGAA
ncbi:MAG: HAMP domain-containing protein [Methanosarcinales archaeon]|nr:MAG: HAMP domain-containing protein [Methanosarcinales archaeon]